MKKIITAFLLIVILFSGISYAEDQAKNPVSLEEIIKAAALGDAMAQHLLGQMHHIGANIQGEEIPQDYKKALYWYTKAAQQGHLAAQTNLGLIYDKGQGVPQDYQKALQWYTRAAEQGSSAAQYNLGVMYDNGQGVAQDYSKALQWYTLAAEQGNAEAQYNLGLMYKNGQGAAQDYSTALLWYTRAAKQGVEQAQNNLGLMYAQGQGVPQDYQKAYVWLSLSASNGGGARAMAARDLSASLLTPQALAEAQAIAEEYYQKYVLPFQ